ncbi:MAG: peptidoglycan-binding protein LysM, partial [Rhodothermales bacterium]|nr:peptidoglycan-binding protein LysM [Rhodothermales bacterium]
MGILDFLRDKGEDVTGKTDPNAHDPEAGAKVKQYIERRMGGQVSGLGVRYEGGRVTLIGKADSQAAKEKAVLLAGNIRGVSAVDGDKLTVEEAEAAPEATYYTVESGDTLSGIAKRYYGDPNEYHKLFEANREVIQDPDKIYPGQKIRVP